MVDLGFLSLRITENQFSVNQFITKRSILDVATVLDPPLNTLKISHSSSQVFSSSFAIKFAKCFFNPLLPNVPF